MGIPDFQARQGRRRSAAAALLLACAALLASGAFAAAVARKAPDDARARYLADRAACMDGRTQQDRATCLREAGAALQEARRGRLVEPGASYERNRYLRCNPLPPDQKQDCIRRMNGEGIVRGSVEEGGIYRELRTIVPAPADSAPAGRR